MEIMMNPYCYQRTFCAASFHMPPLRLPAQMGETHLWYTVPDEVQDTGLLNQYMELLSPCEKENVLSLRDDQLRKRALLSRALLRTTIAKYQICRPVDPKSLKFRKNIYGKPELDWQNDGGWHPPRLHFNISHSSSLIACGITMEHPVGVDVEEKQRKIKGNVLAFARRYFSPHEVEFLASISDPEVQREKLLRLWTLKEAYVKALGKGFSAAPFKNFSIHFRDADITSHFDAKGPVIVVEPLDNPENLTSDWQFALLELAGSHYGAICIERAKITEGERSLPMKLMTWKTIPLLDDEPVSGTDAVIGIGGLIEQLE